jgi:hypothetical protein
MSVDDVAGPAERLANDVGLDVELPRSADVLPVAPSAPPGYGCARRFDAERRGLDDRQQSRSGEVTLCSDELDIDHLARKRARHEHHSAAFLASQSVATRHESLDGEARSLHGLST